MRLNSCAHKNVVTVYIGALPAQHQQSTLAASTYFSLLCKQIDPMRTLNKEIWGGQACDI